MNAHCGGSPGAMPALFSCSSAVQRHIGPRRPQRPVGGERGGVGRGCLEKCGKVVGSRRRAMVSRFRKTRQNLSRLQPGHMSIYQGNNLATRWVGSLATSLMGERRVHRGKVIWGFQAPCSFRPLSLDMRHVHPRSSAVSIQRVFWIILDSCAVSMERRQPARASPVQEGAAGEHAGGRRQHRGGGGAPPAPKPHLAKTTCAPRSNVAICGPIITASRTVYCLDSRTNSQNWTS